MRTGPWLALLAAACAAPPPAPQAACRVEQVAGFPVTLVGQVPVVTALVNGATADLILDTGADRMVLTPSAASRLGVAAQPDKRLRMAGLVGTLEAATGRPASLQVGSLVASPLPAVLTALPLESAGGRVLDGLLGSDTLSRVDVELDLPSGRVGLYRVSGCAGDFLPWRGPRAAVALTLSDSLLRPGLQVRLDGHRLWALLDSGTEFSIVTTRTAVGRLGLAPASLDEQPVAVVARGLDQHNVAGRLHRFQLLEIGTERFVDRRFLVADLRDDQFDMVLGADFLATRRVWISYATAQLFIQRGAPAQ